MNLYKYKTTDLDLDGGFAKRYVVARCIEDALNIALEQVANRNKDRNVYTEVVLSINYVSSEVQAQKL